MLDAILVDFDGTLANTEGANSKAYSNSLKNFGFVFSQDVIMQRCIGRHWSNFLPELLQEHYSQELASKIAQRKKEIYPNFYNEIQINQALINLLEDLKGIPKVIVTNASKEPVLQILEKFNISKMFDLLICQEDVVNPKPHPEGYLLALSLLNANKSRCIAIEDSKVGVLAAKGAGIPVIQVSPLSHHQ